MSFRYQISDNSHKSLMENIKKVKEQKEIYIIKNNKNGDIFIVESGLEVLMKIGIYEKISETDLRELSSNFLELVYHFVETFILESNKFKSFKTFTVYKYKKITSINKNKTHKKMPYYLIEFNVLLKSKESQIYFRTHKLNRILC